ncbi:MAG: glycosyltransferase [Actinomycetota bacterium]
MSGDGHRRLRVLTWHVHGSYLWYLSHLPHDLILPTRPDGADGYAGRAGTFPWPDNVTAVPAEAVADLDVDVVVFQSARHWLEDQHDVLSAAQRCGPRIYVEHDPPRASPTDTVHPVDDPDVLVVHVTPFNRLMWDNGSGPTRVIDHGVALPGDIRWTGELERGLVVVNHLGRRGRRLGADVFDTVRRQIPLDLVGMGSEELGGLGEIKPPGLPAFAARYRFLFNPIRWTSLGLAVCEAMMAGVPIVGLATTEMATAVQSGVSGYVDTDVDRLVARMRSLLSDPALAARLSDGARRAAQRRFSIDRFVTEWDAALREVAQSADRRPAGVEAAQDDAFAQTPGAQPDA